MKAQPARESSDCIVAREKKRATVPGRNPAGECAPNSAWKRVSLANPARSATRAPGSARNLVLPASPAPRRDRRGGHNAQMRLPALNRVRKRAKSGRAPRRSANCASRSVLMSPRPTPLPCRLTKSSMSPTCKPPLSSKEQARSASLPPTRAISASKGQRLQAHQRRGSWPARRRSRR